MISAENEMKKRESIGVMIYDNMKFKWISSHWDIHLNGTCYFCGDVCEFVTEEQPIGGPLCRMYKLTLWKKLSWWWRQKTFEFAVGYHWTYPYREMGVHYVERKPKWLHRLLLGVFYRNWRILFKGLL